jgi:hypothetical protein
MKIEYDMENFYVIRDGKPTIMVAMAPEQRLEMEAAKKQTENLILYGESKPK